MNTPTDTDILNWLERHVLEVGWVQHTGLATNIFLRQSATRPSVIEGFASIRDAVAYAMAHDAAAPTQSP